MTWVRQSPEPDRHQCVKPTKEVTHAWPVDGGKDMKWVETAVSGAVGDLWRCDFCGRLWRVVGYWDSEYRRYVATEWEPATWWQRLRNRKPKSDLSPPIQGGDVD